MHTKKITVRITQTGQTMEMAVCDKRSNHITVILGEGANCVKCNLTRRHPLAALARLRRLGDRPRDRL